MSERIAVDAVQVGQRRRPLDDAKVGELADSMARVGLLEPIVVSANRRLIAGLHRLKAAQFLGWIEIEAMVIGLSDGLLLELAEIDENLVRADLTTLERSQHLARRVAILEELGHRAKPSPGTNQYTGVVGATVAPTTKTTADLAAEMGVSERTAQNYQRIGRDVVPEAQDLISDTPVAESTTQLLDLAREEPEVQVAAASLIANGSATTVPEALRIVDPERPAPATNGKHEPTLGELLPADMELPPGKLSPVQKMVFASGRLHVGTKFSPQEMAAAAQECEALTGAPDFASEQRDKARETGAWLLAYATALEVMLSAPRLRVVGAAE